MYIFFDLNTLVDVAVRMDAYPASLALYERIRASVDHQGAFAACGYTTLHYVLRPRIGNGPETLALLQSFRHWLTFLPFTERTAASAHRLPMADFEDACQAATAWEGACDVIATRNVRDFAASPVRAQTPEEILAQLLAVS